VVGLAEAAGVVLAGGRSSRMGRPKAALEWHGSTLLHRTTALLARTVGGPVLVVAAPGQDLPELPPGVEVVEDPIDGQGPMRGLATGLAALGERSPAAFVCSTDLPFLHPALIRRVLRGFADPESDTVDVVLPVARGYRQPLAAGYRTALAGLVEKVLAEGDLRPGMLFRHCRVAQLDDAALLTEPELARHDPGLDSLVNVNEPDDYAAALARPEPEVLVERFGALASGGRRGPRLVRAASLGAAAAAVGMTRARHIVAAVNGDQMTRDARLPLVTGDTVAFLSADAGG
jgi:molybdopterin-guanine dinucleotide biosynthesis protein A